MNSEFAEFIVNKNIRAYNNISQNGIYRDYLPLLRKDVERFVNLSHSGDKILDLGCGDAPLLRYIKNRKIYYFGVDTSLPFIKRNREKYGDRGEFRVVPPFSLPFPDNYFKVVYSFSVLHNIPSIKLRYRFLREARRVLGKDGRMILTVWNLFAFSKLREVVNLFNRYQRNSLLDLNDVFLPYKDSTGKILAQRYFHAFTLNELKNNVLQAGFKILEDGYLDRVKNKKANIYIIARKITLPL